MHDGHILIGFLGALTTAIGVLVYKEYTEQKALKEEFSKHENRLESLQKEIEKFLFTK